MIIYVTDQFTAIDVAQAELSVEDLDRANDLVAGSHADMVRKMFGGIRIQKREVSDFGYPDKGYVWFQPDELGILRKIAANYDSSD